MVLIGAHPGLSRIGLFLLTLSVLAQGSLSVEAPQYSYEFERDTYVITEGLNNSADVYIVRSADLLGSPSYIYVMTMDGTAIAGQDYTQTSDNLTFADQTSMISLSVPISNDTDGSVLRCFNLTLSSPIPSGSLGPPAKVCIIENDGFFGGTCPPPEALQVIEYNADDDKEEPVIERNVVTNEIAVHWTDPTGSGGGTAFTNCFQRSSQNYGCDSGDLFPITDTLVDYGGRIFVQYTVTTSPVENCEFYIRVSDKVLPEITCPSDITEPATLGSRNGTANWTEPMGTDNSLMATTTSDFTPPATFSIGTHEVNYTVTDPSGNVNSCTFHVIIEDSTDPTVRCPEDMIVNTDQGRDFATVDFEAMDIEDNSDDNLTAVGTPASGSAFGVGNNSVTLTATDMNGRNGSCVFFIFVLDQEPPNITCPVGYTIKTDDESSMATYQLPSPTASDNTGNYIITIDVYGSQKSVGDEVSLNLTNGTMTLHTLVYTVKDQSGNNESCSLTVKVIDEEKPVLTCPENTIKNLDDGLSTANVTFEMANVTDNSGVEITPTPDKMSGSAFDEGETPVTFSATDPSGNNGNCTFTVTVKDLEAPKFTDCPGLTFSTSPSLPNAFVTFDLPNATDNVQVTNIYCFHVNGEGEQLSVGVYTVTCVALDAAGLNDTCMFNITVEAYYSFDKDLYIVRENTDSTVDVFVNRSSDVDFDSSVDVMTMDGTAIAVQDYTQTSASLTFTGQAVMVPFVVPISSDSVEGYTLRCFYVILSDPRPSGIVGPQTKVCIVEDDGFFGGTCPPPEALQVIEYNEDSNMEEPIIERNVVDDTIAVSWTNPTGTGGETTFTNCYERFSQNYGCDSGDLFPITDTLVDYDGRILVEHTVLVSPVEMCRFFIRIRGKLIF